MQTRPLTSLLRRRASLALTAACAAVAACGATADERVAGDAGARDDAERMRAAADQLTPRQAASAPATVSGECARLSPDDSVAAIERLQGLGALGDWTLYGPGRTFACSEPLLDDRVECELAPGASAALTSDAGELLIFENQTDLVVSAHIGPEGVTCVATDAGVRPG